MKDSDTGVCTISTAPYGSPKHVFTHLNAGSTVLKTIQPSNCFRFICETSIENNRSLVYSCLQIHERMREFMSVDALKANASFLLPVAAATWRLPLWPAYIFCSCPHRRSGLGRSSGEFTEQPDLPSASGTLANGTFHVEQKRWKERRCSGQSGVHLGSTGLQIIRRAGNW